MKEIKIENDNIIDKIIEFICKYLNISITIKEITKSEIIWKIGFEDRILVYIHGWYTQGWV